jgi:hypothetical protein
MNPPQRQDDIRGCHLADFSSAQLATGETQANPDPGWKFSGGGFHFN